MRILLTTFAVKSHIFTQVPLAWALRAAGHDVRIATQPEGEADVVSAGLTFVPVGTPIGPGRRHGHRFRFRLWLWL